MQALLRPTDELTTVTTDICDLLICAYYSCYSLSPNEKQRQTDRLPDQSEKKTNEKKPTKTDNKKQHKLNTVKTGFTRICDLPQTRP